MSKDSKQNKSFAPHSLFTCLSVMFFIIYLFIIIIIGASPRFTTKLSCLLGFTVLNELGCLRKIQTQQNLFIFIYLTN